MVRILALHFYRRAVPNRRHFVHKHDLDLKVRGDRETQPHADSRQRFRARREGD
jgi:hypothetical protein